MEEIKKEETNKDLVITITLNAEGLNVNGPINNEPIALYMLEKAKDIVKAHNLALNSPRIERPTRGAFGMPRFKI